MRETLSNQHHLPCLTPAELAAAVRAAGQHIAQLALPGVTISHARLDGPAGGRHRQSEFCLAIHLDAPGQLEWDLGDGRWQRGKGAAGESFLWQPTVERHLHWRGRLEFVSLHFSNEYLNMLARQSAANWQHCIPSRARVRDPFLHRLGRAIAQDLCDARLPGNPFRESVAMAAGTHLLRHYALPRAPIMPLSRGLAPSSLQRVLEHLDERLDDRVTLRDLARVAGLSQFHFSRQFRHSLGESPHQYILRRRLERAKELLRDRRLSIGEIALRLGFSDQSHFCRHFKRWTQTTPGEFRRRS